MIKGILFDKDGTLLEFHSTMHHIYANVFNSLKDRYGVPELLLQQMKKGFGASAESTQVRQPASVFHKPPNSRSNA